MLSLISELTPVQYIPQLLGVLNENVPLLRALFSNDILDKKTLPEHLQKVSQVKIDKFIRFCAKAMTELLNRCKNVDDEQRGRIYIFLQKILPLFEKSQMNLLGEINQSVLVSVDPNDEDAQSHVDGAKSGKQDENFGKSAKLRMHK